MAVSAALGELSGLSGLSGGEAVLCGRLLYVRKVLAALVPSVLGAPCFVDGAPKAGKMLEGVANERPCAGGGAGRSAMRARPAG
ncbi:hypothetical protein HaLaN_10426 [Haematococcus lacustris]|uniref:Uncharacterized protein n=1 Tax=Haematococcus lacustris TaxID=44745 RepID=A0A699Z655_HAELA|nr:hypothetical protein HaLaN_10426 [Haematococcus lacustris]